MHINRSAGMRESLLRVVFNDSVETLALGVHATFADAALHFELMASRHNGDPILIQIIMPDLSSQYDATGHHLAARQRSSSIQLH